jgi:hypothetical protein
MHEVLPIAEQSAAVRFDYFSEVVSRTFCPMHCEPGSTALGSFEADVSLARLDELALTVIGSTPIDVHRRRSDISRVSDAWYLVKFQLEGEALICQREREAHEAFLKEYEAHFSETRDEATARELGIVTKQAKKLETRTTFKETKASDLSGSTLRNLIERTASRVE